MRPIDVVRRNGLALTSLGTSRVSAYGCVPGVGMVDIDMDADQHIHPGSVMKIWPAPDGIADAKNWVRDSRFAIVLPDGQLVTKAEFTLPTNDLGSPYMANEQAPIVVHWGMSETGPLYTRTEEESQKINDIINSQAASTKAVSPPLYREYTYDDDWESRKARYKALEDILRRDEM